ncbi:MAG: putative beta-lactamase [Symbiobacteriaceae bacterium]|jgi:beta-lactamase class A|nr:putative beta-lactamase [Symbiobacteriaceae bacterium]
MKEVVGVRKWLVMAVAALVLIPTAALYIDDRSVHAEAQEFHATNAVGQTPAVIPAVTEPAPPPKPTWEKAPLLDAAVARAMQDFAGEYSVVVHDLASGEEWFVNPNRQYHPASTIKMPVTLYALEQYRAGKLDWQEMITYTQADFESPGGGAFETAPFGGRYPVENLVGRALRYSNNVAVNMLGRHLGWENIRTWTKSVGGDLMRGADGSPIVTAMSELGWWRHLEQVSRVDPKNAELILQPLREVAYDGRIAAGLPEGVKYLHKFGSYDGNYHDGGWIMGEKPFLLIVMTHGASVEAADAAIARVTAEIYNVMK